MKGSSKQKKVMVGALLLAAIGVSIPGTGAFAGEISREAQKAEVPAVLDKGKWAPATYTAVQNVIEKYSKDNPGYDAKAKPYAAFDWDDTSIINDVTDKFFLYQMDQLAYKLTPSEFANVVKLTVPSGVLTGVKNDSGKPITLEQITNDLKRDYDYLYAHYEGFKGSSTLEEIRQTDQFHDFKIKLYFLYRAISKAYGANIAYPWEIYFCANMTEAEVVELATASHRHSLSSAISEVKGTSPASMAGEAGVVSISYVEGMRLAPEISNLMNTLRSNGIDVYVVSAGFEPVVEAIASSPEFGYNVPKDHVFGLRLEQNAQNQYQPLYKKDYPFTYREGKAELIRKEIAVKSGGRDPILVAGDSNSDYGNFTLLKGIELGLIVNHLSSGDFGNISKEAASQIGKSNPKYVLQGVDEVTGLWRPAESTIRIGTNQEALLNEDLK